MHKRPLLLIIICLLLGFFFATSNSCMKKNVATPGPGLKSTNTIMHKGLKRTYHLYVPERYDSKNPAALVFVLHGGGGTGNRMGKFTGVSALADHHGFIAIYPNAVEKHWNDGRDLEDYRSNRENIDDVGFISALIDTIASRYNLDHKRVYVTGISNGAMMSFRLACELTDKITAIAPVVGSFGENISKVCEPSRPIPVIIIGGTGDPLVPWNGGHVHLFRKKFGKVLSFADTTRFWVEHNGCSADPDISWLADVDPEDGTRIRKKVYSQCNQGVRVILYEIQGGGHTWPGGPQYLPEWMIGINSKDLDAAEVIWDFFDGISMQN